MDPRSSNMCRSRVNWTMSPTVRCLPPCSLPVTSHVPKEYALFWCLEPWLVLPNFALYVIGSYSMFSFVSSFFCSILCLWDSSILLCVSIVYFHHRIVFGFVNMLQCYLSILLMDIQVVSSLELLQSAACTWWTYVCMHFCWLFLGVELLGY